MLPERRITDRRRDMRTRHATEPARSELASMIIGMYREMPGLCLHVHQAARLFGVQIQTCRAVLDDLVAGGRLHRLPDGQYAIG